MGIFGGSTPKPPKPPPPPELPASVASPDVQRAAMFSRVGSMAGFAGTMKSSGAKKKNPMLQTIIPGGGKGNAGVVDGSTVYGEEGGTDSVVSTLGTGNTAVAGPPAPRVPAPDWSLYPKGTVGGTATTATVVKPKKKKGKGK